MTQGDLNLLALAQIIEKSNDYSQYDYFHVCGTPACALGHWAYTHPERWTFDPLINTVRFIGPLPEKLISASVTMRNSQGIWEDFEVPKTDIPLLFGAQGCGGAGYRPDSGAKAAAFLREYVNKRVAARASAC